MMRSYEDWLDSLRCYDWLPDSVTGAMDIDLAVERKGNLLLIEAKRMIGPRILVPLGQWLTLRTLAGLPNVTVWLVGEHAKNDEYSLFEMREDSRPHDTEGKHMVLYTSGTALTLDQLKERVAAWWDKAERGAHAIQVG